MIDQEWPSYSISSLIPHLIPCLLICPGPGRAYLKLASSLNLHLISRLMEVMLAFLVPEASLGDGPLHQSEKYESEGEHLPGSQSGWDAQTQGSFDREEILEVICLLPPLVLSKWETWFWSPMIISWNAAWILQVYIGCFGFFVCLFVCW